jgi:oxaloacetate decarboxylase gamma subunit
LGQSGVLTLLGMGVVFGFLVIMVISVTIMGKIIHALGIGTEQTGKKLEAPGAEAQGQARTSAVTAAIGAAVTEYQKDNSI